MGRDQGRHDHRANRHALAVLDGELHAVGGLDKTSAEKLKDQYKKSAGKTAKERWARVDIIAGIVAAEVEEVE